MAYSSPTFYNCRLLGTFIISISKFSVKPLFNYQITGELGIVVSKKYYGLKIGTTLIQMVIDWCKGNGVTTRIHLDVSADNLIAISMYLKFGFVIEGCLRNQTMINGKYYDTYVMGMMIK